MNAPRKLAMICLLGLLTAMPVWAQDETADSGETGEAADENGRGKLFAEFGSWVAQPVGLDYAPASRINFDDPLDTRLMQISHGTQNRNRVRVGYDFNNVLGELVLTWYSHEDFEGLSDSTPAVFQFGETLVHPTSAGFGEDGLADAFIAGTDTKIRDFRLDYYRPAFENPRASAKWFVGVRRFFHRRSQEVEYLALLPELPVLLPPLVSGPRPDLEPQPDAVRMRSDYNGRGAEAGIEFTVPLWKDRVVAEAGILLGVLRGTADTTFESVTYFYAVTESGQITEILTPPYEPRFTAQDPLNPNEFLVNRISQFAVPVGIKSDGTSMSSQVLETHLGFRWWAWRGLQVLGGFRNAHFDEVALDLRPTAASLEQAERTHRSVGYEGYYLGVAYTY